MAPDRYHIKKIVNVEVDTLASVLSKHLKSGQKIDFMSIDVEGLDIEVLKSNDWTKFRPSYLLIEDLDFTMLNIHKSELVKYLATLGYEPKAFLRRTLIFAQT